MSEKIPVWRSIIRDAALNSPKAFLTALKAKNCQISNWAKDITSKPDFRDSFSDTEQKYDLFLLITAQLTGKKEGGTTEEVFVGADRLGFQKCPAWIGHQLRLDYHDQPNKEWFLAGMELITVSSGGPSVFCLECDDSELWLDGIYAGPHSFWHSDFLWIFCRPHK